MAPTRSPLLIKTKNLQQRFFSEATKRASIAMQSKTIEGESNKDTDSSFELKFVKGETNLR